MGGGSSNSILNVIQGWKGANKIPLAEIRMNNVEVAIWLRKLIANKRKAGANFGRIYLANSMNLVTKVRIKVLKAIEKSWLEHQNL